jgi:hypothetical protein
MAGGAKASGRNNRGEPCSLSSPFQKGGAGMKPLEMFLTIEERVAEMNISEEAKVKLLNSLAVDLLNELNAATGVKMPGCQCPFCKETISYTEIDETT